MRAPHLFLITASLALATGALEVCEAALATFDDRSDAVMAANELRRRLLAANLHDTRRRY